MTTIQLLKREYLQPRRFRSNQKWLSADVQERNDLLLIQLIKVEEEEEKSSNIIKVKMRRNPASAASETYELNMAMFKHGQT